MTGNFYIGNWVLDIGHSFISFLLPFLIRLPVPENLLPCFRNRESTFNPKSEIRNPKFEILSIPSIPSIPSAASILLSLVLRSAAKTPECRYLGSIPYLPACTRTLLAPVPECLLTCLPQQSFGRGQATGDPENPNPNFQTTN